MANVITVAMADSYFNAHLDGDVWLELAEGKKEQALYTSEIDVSLELRIARPIITDAEAGIVDGEQTDTYARPTYTMMAVYEWAAILAQNSTLLRKMEQAQAKGLKSQEVEGLGEEVYNTEAKAYAEGPRRRMLVASRAGQMIRAQRGPMKVVR